MFFDQLAQLDLGLLVLLIFALVCACVFEFVNGFHDTANAVATVIYTDSLKPNQAVVLSGICNFLGVFVGGISVAMGIVNLLPVETLISQDAYQSIGMILALLFTAILWNLGTWWLGIPCSSTHTLIASIIGVGIGYSFLPESKGVAVDWSKASEIGIQLLLSPLVGFCVTIFFMFVFKKIVKNKEIFKSPDETKKRPKWVKYLLIGTCSGVSFAHGSNDGQKGVGLIMLILIGIMPTYFAFNPQLNPVDLKRSTISIENTLKTVSGEKLNEVERKGLEKVKTSLDKALHIFSDSLNNKAIKDNDRFVLRKELMTVAKKSEKIIIDNNEELKLLSPEQIALLKQDIKHIKTYTEYAPKPIIILVALCIGLGTMIGWKRIVVTIGEKIGKEHLTYAQGASSELAAATTIAFSTFIMKLPVSTTQVLSSGIAGSMVANKGVGNLQTSTLRSIAIAWLLTFPVCVAASATLFLLFRSFL